MSKIVKIQQPKKPETRTEVDFLFERAILLKEAASLHGNFSP